MVTKIRKKLTSEQKERGIVFTSTLSEDRDESGNTTHEVMKNDSERYEKIKRLKDDKFFNGSHYKYNIIRQ